MVTATFGVVGSVDSQRRTGFEGKVSCEDTQERWFHSSSWCKAAVYPGARSSRGLWVWDAEEQDLWSGQYWVQLLDLRTHRREVLSAEEGYGSCVLYWEGVVGLIYSYPLMSDDVSWAMMEQLRAEGPLAQLGYGNLS